jgi:hypothetical protein
VGLFFLTGYGKWYFCFLLFNSPVLQDLMCHCMIITIYYNHITTKPYTNILFTVTCVCVCVCVCVRTRACVVHVGFLFFMLHFYFFFMLRYVVILHALGFLIYCSFFLISYLLYYLLINLWAKIFKLQYEYIPWMTYNALKSIAVTNLWMSWCVFLWIVQMVGGPGVTCLDYGIL